MLQRVVQMLSGDAHFRHSMQHYLAVSRPCESIVAPPLDYSTFELRFQKQDLPDFRVGPEAAVEEDAFRIAASAIHHDLCKEMTDGCCIVVLDSEKDACLRTAWVYSMPMIVDLV